MRYIRTKDGRIVAYGTEEDSGYSKGCIRIQNKPKICASADPIEILKEADTIEKLCDVFVVRITLTEHNYALCRYEGLSQAKLVSFQNNAPLYGAVWTDKGLIYVAKMNKKGELELL